MKKFACASIAAILAISPVAAADLYLPNPEQVIVDPIDIYGWSGLYLGANVGYGWLTVESGGQTFDQGRGMLGGIQAGYNHDFGGLVLGAETDLQLSNIGYDEVPAPGITARTQIDSFGTLRGRVGIAADRFLPYVTGGVAYANASISLAGPGGSVRVEDTYVGWTVGGGVEYAVTDNVSIKGEYLYLDFGAADFGTGVDSDLTSHVARVGLNYRF